MSLLIHVYFVDIKNISSNDVDFSESGHPQFRLERELLKERLRMKPVEEADELPLLYSLVSYFSKESKPSTSADVPTAEKS
ncbi:hypothetical protein AVEN_137894-1 [Araneus ventricosus]|uniref:Uncharacterized protein n=1 Tax=Araneus ventricosus TaxID=182803 RepID=A0A4Y2V4Y4_ARAVE|nr:hypothetical protein AVEN_22744-1 [Araneus ventricosus]GBO20325.1 hypothetical protein AVEN_137894-1 [Araneus ventricosus]